MNSESAERSIVIVAGEASGDMHAAACVRLLKAKYPKLQVSGIGGEAMEQAGVTLVSDLACYGVTGLTEILRHASTIRRAFKTIKNHLQEKKPDLLILVDYPGFNLRLARYAKLLNIKVLYYISPQIWAWKSARIKIIQAAVDHMAVILPFEKKIYTDAQVPVSFVGHPLLEKIPSAVDIKALRTRFHLPLNTHIMALLPGSRINEIKYLMPVLVESAQRVYNHSKNIHFVIPRASSIALELLHHYLKDTELPYTIVENQAIEVMAASDSVVVASGTASLECALLEKPMCIIYKGAALSYMLAVKWIKVYYFGLCNLLQNKMIVPELLQYDCNPHELSKTMLRLMYDTEFTHRMQKNLYQMKLSLSEKEADCSIDVLIEKILLL